MELVKRNGYSFQVGPTGTAGGLDEELERRNISAVSLSRGSGMWVIPSREGLILLPRTNVLAVASSLFSRVSVHPCELPFPPLLLCLGLEKLKEKYEVIVRENEKLKTKEKIQ